MGDRSAAHEFADRMGAQGIAELNSRFRDQRETLNFHYTCRHCTHLSEETELCSLEYPNEELKQADEGGWALNDQGDIVFCKYFELD